jgi:ferritin-like metal-binding protein YciE
MVGGKSLSKATSERPRHSQSIQFEVVFYLRRRLERIVMKLISENVRSLEALYVLGLRKALDMEQKIANALVHLHDRSSDEELSQAFLVHLDQTRSHATVIQALIDPRTLERTPVDSKTTDSLWAATADVLADVQENSIRDIGIIGIAQQIEHHEIAVYGTLRRWAELLGLTEDAAAIESIQAEEVDTDEILSDISERVNVEAAA